jgi:hypothetical protein
MVLLLPVPPALFLVSPLWAEAPQASAAETDWNNLQQLSLAARLLIERSDGTRVKGRLISVAEDALSVRKDKAVVGVARPEVGRIWLLGKSKARKGALIGAVVGGAAGAVLGAALFRSYESGENYGVLFGLVLGGVGAGVGAGAGAGVGAGFRERALIYRAPPPGEPSTAASHTAPCEAPADLAPCAHPLSAPGPLPAVLEEVYRPFNMERAIRELVQETNTR